MNCKDCIHDNDEYFCGSYCMYGDCFKSTKDNNNRENKDSNKES